MNKINGSKIRQEYKDRAITVNNHIQKGYYEYRKSCLHMSQNEKKRRAVFDDSQTSLFDNFFKLEHKNV